MIIYVNADIEDNIEDHDNVTIHYDDLIFSSSGIFKKYKYHFFECNVVKEAQKYSYESYDFFVQKDEITINKQNLLTSIPFQHYYVKRKTLTSPINDKIMMVKEIDNDMFHRHYFICNRSIEESLHDISLFLYKKV